MRKVKNTQTAPQMAEKVFSGIQQSGWSPTNRAIIPHSWFFMGLNGLRSRCPVIAWADSPGYTYGKRLQ